MPDPNRNPESNPNRTSSQIPNRGYDRVRHGSSVTPNLGLDYGLRLGSGIR